ncbi:MAG: hypothetical protein K2Q20_14040, partial [Phycisphaerales bacterium]|nr:hypothetical protein [Phycisphaerales bacterium]
MRTRYLLAALVAALLHSTALAEGTYNRSGGGVVLVTESTLPAVGDATKTYRITNATNAADCASGSPGSARADCRWNGSAYEAVGVAATGLTNPLVAPLDAAGNAITNVGPVDGRDVSSDGSTIDKLTTPYDQIIRITSHTTACSDYTSAFKTYHNGTAAEGQYRVKVVFDLRGSNKLLDSDLYDDSGNWPYKSCFIHHPVSPTNGFGTGNAANFPDSIGRINNGVAVVNHTGGIEVTVDYEGTIEVDKTGQAKNAVLFDYGNLYMAGCAATDPSTNCNGSFYGNLGGALRLRGAINVEVVAQNDGSWTGEGTPSMGPNARLSKEAATAFLIFGANGATYMDAGELSINPFWLGNTDFVYQQLGSWGMVPPRLNSTASQNDGIGAMLYGYINWATPAEWRLKGLDHGMLLGDADNGGSMIFYANCDALDSTNGTCGDIDTDGGGADIATGNGFTSQTTGVHVNGLLIEGPTWSSISSPTLGSSNQIRNIYAETSSGFLGKGIAIGPQYCDGVSGTSPKPKGKIVLTDDECANTGTGGVAAISPNHFPSTVARLDLHFTYTSQGRAAGGRGLIFGDACTTNVSVKVDTDATMLANPDNSEFEIGPAIASSGGCAVKMLAPPGVAPYPTYYNLVEDWDPTRPANVELQRLVDNCALEADGTPIPDSCVGDGTDGGGGSDIPITGGGVAVNGPTAIDFTSADPGILVTGNESGSNDTVEFGFEFSGTYASINSVGVAEQCFFTVSGSGAGGFICEGPTANTTDHYFTFTSPTDSGADAERFIPLASFGLSVTGHTAARTMTIPNADFTAVGLADVQTLTNKTFTTPVINNYLDMAEAAAPATPSAGVVRLYAKNTATAEFCSKDDAGVETCMSAGSGGGGGWTDGGAIVEPTSATDDVGIGWDGAGATPSDWAFYFDESAGELRINVPGGRLFVQPDATLGGCLGVSEGSDDGGHTASFCMPDSATLAGDTAIDAIGTDGRWLGSAVNMATATGLPISTGVSGLGTGIASFLATPSSANLRTALTDETGSGGAAVFASSPTIDAP